MSRGPGRVQRAIMDALTDGERSVSELRETVYGAHPTDSETRALNRAIRGLLTAGLVIDTYESTTYWWEAQHGRKHQRGDPDTWVRLLQLTPADGAEPVWRRSDKLCDPRTEEEKAEATRKGEEAMRALFPPMAECPTCGSRVRADRLK